MPTSQESVAIRQIPLVELKESSNNPPAEGNGLRLVQNPGRRKRRGNPILQLTTIIYAVAILLITERVYSHTQHPGPAVFFAACAASFYILCYNALSMEAAFKAWADKRLPLLRNVSIALALALSALPLGALYLMQSRDAARASSQPATTDSRPQKVVSPPANASLSPAADQLRAVDDTASDHTAFLTGIRYWSDSESTKIEIALNGDTRYEAHRLTGPDRIYLDFPASRLDAAFGANRLEVQDSLLRKIRVAEHEPDQTRVTMETQMFCDYSIRVEQKPHRLLIELRHAQIPGGSPSSAS